MNMGPARRTWMMLVAVLGLVLSGCASDDDGGGGATEPDDGGTATTEPDDGTETEADGGGDREPVTVGMVTTLTGNAAYLLPRVVGLGRAMEILYFGDRIDAESAERMGLANRVLDDEDLLPEAQAWARRLADGPTFALAMTKRLVSRELDMDLHGAIEMEAITQAFLMRSEDHDEFFAAQRDKRAPEWRGR